VRSKSHHLVVRGKLLSINAERKTHMLRRADIVRQWRTDAALEAKVARLPHLGRVSVIAQPFQHGSVLADVGNHLPSIKACIDGLVDAQVLSADDPSVVTALTFLAPQRVSGNGADYVVLELIESAK
jgi:crossover junction endodeoxyribonuclease RusA